MRLGWAGRHISNQFLTKHCLRISPHDLFLMPTLSRKDHISTKMTQSVVGRSPWPLLGAAGSLSPLQRENSLSTRDMVLFVSVSTHPCSVWAHARA